MPPTPIRHWRTWPRPSATTFARTYGRIDRPRGQFFHTYWTGRGGDVTARPYQA